LIFISYRREDSQDTAWALADKLQSRYGPKSVFLDREQVDLGSDWRLQIDEALRGSKILFALIGPNWLFAKDAWGRRRIDRDDDVLAYELASARDRSVEVVPLYLHNTQPPPKEALPTRLAYLVERQGLAFEIPRDLPTVYKTIESWDIPPVDRVIAPPPPPPPPPRVFLASLSGAGAPFGRDKELADLNAAWSTGHVNVIVISALAGQGKSSLVNTWLARLAQEDYRGFRAVFGWRFDNVSEGDKEASADLFITAALQWFGDTEPSAGSPWEKGLRLADLIRNQPTLLVLDGIEALQHPLPPNEGRLKEQSLQALLRQLAAHNPGLCLVTSRLRLADVEVFVGGTVQEIQLGALSDPAGAALLSSLGVHGSMADLRSASSEFKGHAFSLTLLGTYLVDAWDGDIRRRSELQAEEDDQTRRVMASYERWLGEGPEIQVLRLLGVFNRPAPRVAIDAVRTEPGIPAVTDRLTHLKRFDWNRTVKRLRGLKLLSDRLLEADEAVRSDELDTHALVRLHFAEQVKTKHPDAWIEAHSRLFDYYKAAAPPLPDTLAQMMPLFHAVAHGCNAGRHQEAWDDVYWPRVRRGDDGFSVITLGAYGLDLSALTNFFAECWDRPGDGLSPHARGLLLSETGFDLRGVGRLEEAAEVDRSALQAHVALGKWSEAANAAGNLSEVLVVLGRLGDAARDAQASIELARRSERLGMQATNTATLGYALHQIGRLEEAEQCFVQAEALSKADNPNITYLHALRGFHFCDLLLDRGRFEEVVTRTSFILAIDEDLQLPHGTGLAHLALAHAKFGLSAAAAGRDDADLNGHLQLAIEQLKRAGHQELVVRALLTAADLRLQMGALEAAEEALDEALAGAIRGQMKLYVADAYLQSACLHTARRDNPKARAAFQKARLRITQMKYGRRDQAVQGIEQRLAKLT
jgi:tetratricopeptide (TPR) repeat protein